MTTNTKYNLTTRILLAMALGILVGTLFKFLLDGQAERIVDLGAGWGFLARAILARDGVRQLDLVEAEAAALDCARRNVTDPRARPSTRSATGGSWA